MARNVTLYPLIEYQYSPGDGALKKIRNQTLELVPIDSISQNPVTGMSMTSSFRSGSNLSPPSIYSNGGGRFGSSEAEEGVARREWRRRNAIELGEKHWRSQLRPSGAIAPEFSPSNTGEEKKEKEKLRGIFEDAEAYKAEFYRKREANLEKKKSNNRERERVSMENEEKFHAEAEMNYWKAVAEMIPREVAAVERKGKREKEKGSVVVVHGSKPGKPTDLSRMRQILVKLLLI